MLAWNCEPTQIQSSGTPRPTPAPSATTPILVAVLDNPCRKAMSARMPAEDNQPVPAARHLGALPPAATIEGTLPAPLQVGSGTALRLEGTLAPGSMAVERVRVRLGSIERDVDAFGVRGRRSRGVAAQWWVVLPVPATTPLGATPLVLMVGGAGEEVELQLGVVELVERVSEPGPQSAPAGTDADGRLIAICMATYEPPYEWLLRQLDSIRAQSWERWVCLISDDCSSPERFADLERAVDGDPRFVVSRSPERLGFYGNFERALRMVPAEAELVALSDQDDRWHPDKLELLAGTLDESPEAALAYSDMRILSEEGEILSDTYWYLQPNGYDDIASLILANTVTGGASLLRRELLDLALPFPSAHSDQHYHDHWLALCALATGDLAYLDRPTYDYTRHADSVTIRQAFEWYAPAHGPVARARLRWRRMTRRLRMGSARPGWRAIYFDRFLLIRQLVAVLELRAGGRIAPAKARPLQLLDNAESSSRALAWLLARSFRPLIGRREALGRERVLLGGLIWRRLAGRRARRSGWS